MRWLWIIALGAIWSVTVLALYREPAQLAESSIIKEGNQSKTKSRKNGKGPNKEVHSQPRPSPTPVQSPEPTPGKQESKEQADNGADHAHDWIDKINAFSTVIIALFTVLLFFAVIQQTGTSRDTERAWVIASPSDNAPVVGFIPEGQSNLEMHLVGCDTRNVFSCSFKSTGNTPARLVEVAIRYVKVNKLADVPKEPTYGERTPLNDLPLVTGDSIGFVAHLEPDIILKKTDHDAVYKQKAFLYAFGIIVYRDVYNRLHENRFGYIYHFPQGGDPRENGFRREGLPPSYNRAT